MVEYYYTAMFLLHSFTSLLVVLFLLRALEKSFTCPTYGVSTRAGFERRWRRLRFVHCYTRYALVLTDLAHFHRLNAERGEATMDATVRAVMAELRTRESGRIYSGDELAWIVPIEDAGGMAARAARAFSQRGVGSDYGIVAIDWHQPIADHIQAAKDQINARRCLDRGAAWAERG